MSLVKCVSTRPIHEDTLYKTGQWIFGEVKRVPDEIAKKMLRHGDVYERATEEEAPDAEDVVIEPPPKEDRTQEAYDAIAKMNKESIRAFVQSNFNRGVDLRQSEAKLRAYATQLVDQYGIL